MESMGIWTKFMTASFQRSACMLLFRCNILAIILYATALQEMQVLLTGILSGTYYCNAVLISQICIKMNSGIFKFILIAGGIWVLLEIIQNEIWIGEFLFTILDCAFVKNIWLTALIVSTVISNVIVFISFVLLFFFQDGFLFQIVSEYPSASIMAMLGMYCAIPNILKE
ncbi:MAG: hypothetical protein ABFD79_13665 [Phycisphaerales bacterium]